MPGAPSRLALARLRQHHREQWHHTAASRAQERWTTTLRQLAQLGAAVNHHEEVGGDE
ncbi:MAG TPA: hypothetical protein VFA10_31545 [Ktedonobacteraceae bacterium]|nr:hypothetical protein [Ktedonobacteraceae bacterium]